jgi:hypothetical protein
MQLLFNRGYFTRYIHQQYIAGIGVCNSEGSRKGAEIWELGYNADAHIQLLYCTMRNAVWALVRCLFPAAQLASSALCCSTCGEPVAL